uniref:Uncharacterized protein n=1 Tax=Physcomitrium patens TaxID=3218 RepID=A0A2K1J1E1_PHYPA|nr:hypothetical protein PHYPA_023244 [Physcomitrium patens]
MWALELQKSSPSFLAGVMVVNHYGFWTTVLARSQDVALITLTCCCAARR